MTVQCYAVIQLGPLNQYKARPRPCVCGKQSPRYRVWLGEGAKGELDAISCGDRYCEHG